ncbi:MAG: hypothetical protein WC516_09415 [Patescibacteria group bacterium]
MKENAIKLDNWSVISNQFRLNPYTTPELIGVCLQGLAENHPRLGDAFVCTSEITEVEGRYVKTRSGTIYKLGNIEPKYRRLLKQIRPDWDYKKPIKILTQNMV